MTIKQCENCGKDVKCSPSNEHVRRFCSFECRKSLYTPEMREKMSSIKKEQFAGGLVPWNRGVAMWDGEARVALVVPALSGEKHWNWKGGITSENISARQNEQYSEWRMEVLHRDDFTCQDCGIRGGKLVAHHIKFFSEYPELRYDVDNGVTMCRGCHSRFHNSNKNTI